MHTLEQLRSGALAGTRRLDLSCGLTELPPEVFDLADTLEVLNLTGNRLHELPPDLGRLQRLKIVFCSSNDFTHLPESLGDCPALEMVGFKANRIQQVPAAALPPKLRWLILTDNAIEQLPAELGQRPALQKLMLAGNLLDALPPGLANAQRLELLRLSANRFTELPGWLTELPRLAWLALAGNPLGWQRTEPAPLPRMAWDRLRLAERLGEGASGHIHRAHLEDAPGDALALKLFKGAVTSDGLPEHELAACQAAGQHPALCTPSAELDGHPEGARGMLLPLLPPELVNLAGPPSFDSCTRDVYAPGFTMPAGAALRLARTMAGALAHLHQRGVMHGDFYAHNILWNPASGDAMLSDLGGATLLPDDQPALRRALLALDVRAFGCLLEELVAHAQGAGATASPALDRLAGLAAACLHTDPAARPGLGEIADTLDNLAH
jgi:hypothetical protein